MKTHHRLPLLLAAGAPLILAAPKVAQAGIWTWVESHVYETEPGWRLLDWVLLMVGLG